LNFGSCETLYYKNKMAEQELMKMKKTELVDTLLRCSETLEGIIRLLSDYGYCPTSDGQVVSFVREIIEENERLEMENEWGKTATLKYNEELNKNEKLEEENKKLKVHNLHYEDCIRALEEDKKEQKEQANIVMDELIEDYNKLKEENDKLKELF